MATAGPVAGDRVVEVVRHGPVAEIAFNRPARRNALDMASREQFGVAVQQVLDDDTVRAIVLTGRGGHFCAGGDIGAMRVGDGMSAEQGRRRMRSLHPAVERLYTCEKAVLAAVEGCAFGAGFGIALLADMLVAGDGARFCMSFARVGLLPDCASLYTLPRVVGLQRAKELLLSAREIDAREAQALGITMETVPAGAALPRALALAAALAQASPTAIALTKTGLAGALSSDLHATLEYEATAQGVAYSSQWHRDAIERFLDKQPPAFGWPPPATG